MEASGSGHYRSLAPSCRLRCSLPIIGLDPSSSFHSLIANNFRVSGRSASFVGSLTYSERTREKLQLTILHPSLSYGITDNSSAAVKVQLFRKAGLIRLDSLDADREIIGNLLVAIAPGYQPQHLRFSIAQLVGRRSSPASWLANETSKYLSRQSWIDVNSALGNDSDGLNQFVNRRSFKQETRGARSHQMAKVGFVLVGSKRQHLDFRAYLLQTLSGLGAIHLRH